MTAPSKHCVYCKKDSHQIPLVAIEYQDKTYWVCPEHIPLMIHEPAKLVGILPGAEKMKPYQSE